MGLMGLGSGHGKLRCNRLRGLQAVSRNLRATGNVHFSFTAVNGSNRRGSVLPPPELTAYTQGQSSEIRSSKRPFFFVCSDVSMAPQAQCAEGAGARSEARLVSGRLAHVAFT